MSHNDCPIEPAVNKPDSFWMPCQGFRITDYWGILEKGYGLLATKFKDYGLFMLHFKITDCYLSLL